MKMFLQPGEIFVGACRIYDEKKLLPPDSIDDQIINDSTALVKKKSVLASAHIEFVDVFGQNDVQPIVRSGSFDNQLSHVRNVENADVVSHGPMFVHNARVLHRHEPARERNDFCAQPHMFVVNWSPFLCGYAHAQSLDFTNGVRNAPATK